MELFNGIHSSCEADVYQPLLDFIRLKKNGKFCQPYIPKCPLLPLHQLCKLAHLWKEAGFEKEASVLADWLLSLEPFLPLWCPEKEYNEAETEQLFSLLPNLNPTPGEKPDIDLTLLKTSQISAALTLDGNGTSLGVIRVGSVEMRAFGPQSASLQFGIKGRGLDGWIHTAAFPEVWLQMKATTIGEDLKLDFRFVGITQETPLSLAFYVKGESCQIGNEILKPKSLRRYQGESQKISFENRVKIETGQPHKVQVIPLAGEGCFWGADFLILFELHPLVSQTSFSICAYS